MLEGDEGDAYYFQSVRVDELAGYFLIALKMMGQLGCKDIAKVWIKMGHPKKQTTNPYNGGKTKEQSTRLYGHAGGLTKPDYWPSMKGWEQGLGCRHSEPDHIKKPGLLKCLLSSQALIADSVSRAVDSVNAHPALQSAGIHHRRLGKSHGGS